MKNINRSFVLFLNLVVIFAAIHCGGGSSGGGGGGDGDEAVAAGLAAFEDRDIESAETEFCDSLADNPTDAQLAFGCFFAKLLLLSEGSDADTLLATLGEDPFDLGALLDTGGLFDDSESIVLSGWPRFNYADFGLPFASTFASAGPGESLGLLLQEAIDNGVDAGELKSQVVAFTDDFEDMEDDLEVVLDDSSFTLDLPAELFYVTNDVTVSYNDVRLMMAGLQGTIFSLAVLNAYDPGVNIDDVVTSGEIDQEILVADLNGSGETVNGVAVDETVFLTLDDASAITDQESRFTEALSNFQTGVQAWIDGETSEFFSMNLNSLNLERAVEVADELTDSLSGLTTMDSFGTETVVSLNLNEFFSNPPDASEVDVGAGDPFVLEDGNAQPVESYFDELLDGIAEF